MKTICNRPKSALLLATLENKSLYGSIKSAINTKFKTENTTPSSKVVIFAVLAVFMAVSYGGAAESGKDALAVTLECNFPAQTFPDYSSPSVNFVWVISKENGWAIDENLFSMTEGTATVEISRYSGAANIRYKGVQGVRIQGTCKAVRPTERKF